MKKILLSAALLLACGSLFVATAQNAQDQKPTPEQRSEAKAYKIANELMLSDDSTQKFVPVYKAYKLELTAVNDKYRRSKRGEEAKGKPLTDKEVDVIIRNDFAKSKEILDIRTTYYEKFLKVLTPKQIKKIYDIEKMEGDMAAHRRWQKNAAKDGSQPGDHKAAGQHGGHFANRPNLRQMNNR